MRFSSIVLLSGGLDSMAAFHWATKESDLILGITYDYGQRASTREIEAAKAICSAYDIRHKVVELPWYQLVNSNPLLDPTCALPKITAADLDNEGITKKSAEAVWVANRNGVFLNIAASLAETMLANWLVVGFNAEEAKTFPDNSEDFVKATNDFFKYSTNGKVVLQSPMGSKTKKEIVCWCMDEKIDLSNLWSCYLGDDKMCGACESCLRLRRALNQAEAGKWLEKLF